MTKIKTITLSHGWRVPGDPVGGILGYRVERITDSVDYDPLQILTKKQVDILCASKEWKVTIVGPS